MIASVQGCMFLGDVIFQNFNVGWDGATGGRARGARFQQGTKGHITIDGEDITELDAEERAHKGVFLSFQYPVEIPGVSVTNFIKTAINENRKAKGLKDMPASEMLKKIKEKADLLEIDRKFLSRSLNVGFSGGEKKRNEIFQMAMLEPKLAILDETDSGLDIDALKVVANGVNKLKNKDNAVIVITHYQRLLDYKIYPISLSSTFAFFESNANKRLNIRFRLISILDFVR